MLKIKTANGHECFIEDDDLKHYKDAEVLERSTDVEVPTDAVPESEGDEE